VFDGEEGGRTAGGDADLCVDVLYVVIRGLRCDHEPVGDLSGAEAESQQPEHLDLAGGETRRQWGTSGPTVPCRGQDPFNGLGVQAASASHGPQFGRSLIGCQCAAVGAIRRHGLVAVRGRDHPLRLVEVRGGEPPVVAGPIQALMRGGRPGQRSGVGDAPEELVGDQRMGLDLVPFIAVEGSGLSQMVLGTATRPRSWTSAAASAVGPDACTARAATVRAGVPAALRQRPGIVHRLQLDTAA